MTVGVIDAFASPTIVKDTNRYATDNGDGSYGPGQFSQVLPSRSSTKARPNGCDAVRLVRRGDAGHRGRARDGARLGHRLLRRGELLRRRHPRHPDAGRRPGRRGHRDATPTASPRRRSAPTWPRPSSRSSSRAHAGHQAACSPPATTATRSPNTGIKQADCQRLRPLRHRRRRHGRRASGQTARAVPDRLGHREVQPQQQRHAWDPAGYLYGAGGGNSALYNKPDYQHGVVPEHVRQRASGAGHRHGRRPDHGHARSA